VSIGFTVNLIKLTCMPRFTRIVTLKLPALGGLAMLTMAGAAALDAQAQQSEYTVSDAQSSLKTYCVTCHQGRTPPGHLDLTRYIGPDSLSQEPQVWSRIYQRVREGSMPPKGMLAPNADQREQLAGWIEKTLQSTICAAGPTPGPAPIRRLNRSQYSTTIRHLFNVPFNAGRSLPEDGAGGEGFDNAAETLFLSPLLAEKYLEAGKEALDIALKNPEARRSVVIARPGPDLTPEQAARRILVAFLPRAFRHPVATNEVDEYVGFFRAGQTHGGTFDDSLLFALQGVLVSPRFLFRVEEPNPNPEPRVLDDYDLASRLSYFLWNSMPDQELFDLAAAGKLRDPQVLRQQVHRMLAPDVRGEDDTVKITKENKLDAMAQQFVEQWLGTRELGRDIKPDAALFPEYYQTELQSAILHEPVVFFKELLTQNLSLLNLLDSNFAMLNNPLQKLYGLNLKTQARASAVGAQLSHVTLPEGSHRGGLLGMSAVLAVSSYPNRTSPVLRGKWILESLLGTPPPAPPPSVPALEEAHVGGVAITMRERLEQHRRDPACATCHSRIDPLGFGLENYDVLGRWRTTDDGLPVYVQGELPDGTKFNGPDELKAVLLSRKDQFIRNLTRKMLGYALGRGLRLEDSCTVDEIVARLKETDYRAQTLVEEIVLSVPFRYQAGAGPALSSMKGSPH
jgi:mono/diheme cytochrome c family protein